MVSKLIAIIGCAIACTLIVIGLVVAVPGLGLYGYIKDKNTEEEEPMQMNAERQ